MNSASAFFEMVDPISKEYHPYSAPTCEPHDFCEADYTYQPGYFDTHFKGILDECSPVVQALAIDAPLDDAQIILSLASSEKKVDKSCGVPFSNGPAPHHVSPGPADASSSSSTCASPPEEIFSAPGSPLFTPISGPVDLPYVQEPEQSEIAPSLADCIEDHTTAIESVNAARVPTLATPATTQPLLALPSTSSSLPVCAADIDVLSLPRPSLRPAEAASALPSRCTADATVLQPSLEFAPIPDGQLSNIRQKRKRGLTSCEDYYPATFSDTLQDQPPATPSQPAQPVFQTVTQNDPVVDVDAPTTGNRYATSVPPSLLDQIAAAAVAATIRASPDVNVFAAPPNPHRIRRPKKSSPLAASSTIPHSYGHNAFPNPGQGMPLPTFPVPPSQTNMNTHSRGPQNAATYPSSAALSLPLYGLGNTNSKRRCIAGLGFTGEPIARQGAITSAAQAFQTSDFQAQPLSGARMSHQNFMNPQSNNSGILTPETQPHAVQGANPMLASSLSFTRTPRYAAPMVFPPNMENLENALGSSSQLWDASPYAGPLQQDFVNRDISYGHQPSSSWIPTQQHAYDTPFYAPGPSTSTKTRKSSGKKRKESIPIANDFEPGPTATQQQGVREDFICRISGCHKQISVLRNGAWSIRRVLQEHGHLPESATNEMITCQWEDSEGEKCMQKTKWSNYTRHFSGHLGVLIRKCDFCSSIQARPSNLVRHFRSCKAFHEQDYETRREAWMKLNTRVDFETFEKSLIRNREKKILVVHVDDPVSLSTIMVKDASSRFPWDQIKAESMRSVCRDLGLKLNHGANRAAMTQFLETVYKIGLPKALGTREEEKQNPPTPRKRARAEDEEGVATSTRSGSGRRNVAPSTPLTRSARAPRRNAKRESGVEEEVERTRASSRSPSKRYRESITVTSDYNTRFKADRRGQVSNLRPRGRVSEPVRRSISAFTPRRRPQARSRRAISAQQTGGSGRRVRLAEPASSETAEEGDDEGGDGGEESASAVIMGTRRRRRVSAINPRKRRASSGVRTRVNGVETGEDEDEEPMVSAKRARRTSSSSKSSRPAKEPVRRRTGRMSTGGKPPSNGRPKLVFDGIDVPPLSKAMAAAIKRKEMVLGDEDADGEVDETMGGEAEQQRGAEGATSVSAPPAPAPAPALAPGPELEPEPTSEHEPEPASQSEPEPEPEPELDVTAVVVGEKSVTPEVTMPVDEIEMQDEDEDQLDEEEEEDFGQIIPDDTSSLGNSNKENEAPTMEEEMVEEQDTMEMDTIGVTTVDFEEEMAARAAEALFGASTSASAATGGGEPSNITEEDDLGSFLT